MRAYAEQKCDVRLWCDRRSTLGRRVWQVVSWVAVRPGITLPIIGGGGPAGRDTVKLGGLRQLAVVCISTLSLYGTGRATTIDPLEQSARMGERAVLVLFTI